MTDCCQLLIKTMADTTNVALSTCAGNMSNVRAVSIGFDEATPDRIYFVTFNDSTKVKAIKENANVVFIPFPDKTDTEAMIRVSGVASPAELSLGMNPSEFITF